MNLERALQYNTAALAVMGAVFLGLGHASPVLPVILVLAAILSVGLARQYSWMRMNRLVANIVALAAVIWSMHRFFAGVGTEGQLLAVADMLVYLQIVLLFQEKSARVYWQLIVLSLLQVVVGAALNLGPHFGILLAAYMLTALAGLVLLCSYHEWRKFGPPRTPPRAHPSGWANLLDEPAAQAPQAAETVAAAARSSGVVRQAAWLAAATIAFAAVYFYAAPRHRDGTWADLRGIGQPNSGFANQVRLKESGRIHLSNQLVMRVSLTSVTTGKPYSLVTEPYFHGLALTDYVHDSSGGRWVAGRIRSTHQLLPASPPDRTVTLSALVQQDYTLEGGMPHAFAILPMFPLKSKGFGLYLSRDSDRIERAAKPDGQRAVRDSQYSVATSALRYGRQLRGIPHRNRGILPGDIVQLQNERELLLRFDAQRFIGLASAAQRVVHEAGLSQAPAFEQALALERHFSDSGLYRYSLTLDFARDPKLDPIEDFVVNHHTGHCEYFASALVIMLRSRGIPARMVLGYKGGDFNTIGDYYQVRQKHAHAWVEALLPPEHVPGWELAGPPSAGGIWYRLDPTPASERPSATGQDKGLAGRIVQTFDYAELLWRDYVLSLNATRQQDSIYDPMTSRTMASLPPWVEERGLRRLLRRAARLAGLEQLPLGLDRPSPSRAIDWRSGVLLVGLFLPAIVVVQGATWMFRFWRTRRSRDEPAIRRRHAPTFYRRLEFLLARLPLRRARGQTARELAAAAADRLHRGGSHAGVAELPGEIVEAYYRVRFGGAALDSREQAAIEHALAELSPAVNQAHR